MILFDRNWKFIMAEKYFKYERKFGDLQLHRIIHHVTNTGQIIKRIYEYIVKLI